MILNLVRRTGEAIFLKCGAWTPIRGSLLVAVLSRARPKGAVFGMSISIAH